MSVLAPLAGVLMNFHIAAGDPDALVKWSTQANYPRFVADLAGARLRAVNGEYTPYGALCELLEGTGLSFRYGLPWESEATVTYYIGREDTSSVLPYEEVCPTLTDVTPAAIEPPRADWR